MSTSTVPPAAGTGGGTRVARLRVRRIDPWSAMKTGFVFAVGLGIAYVIAAGLLFLFSDLAGVFDSFNTTIAELTGDSAVFSFSLGGVIAAAAVFAVIEVIIMTLLFAVMAMLYNAAASVTGGIQVKLAED